MQTAVLLSAVLSQACMHEALNPGMGSCAQCVDQLIAIASSRAQARPLQPFKGKCPALQNTCLKPSPSTGSTRVVAVHFVGLHAACSIGVASTP